MVDNDLTWSSHINLLCRKLSTIIGLLWRIKDYLSYDMKIMYYNAFIVCRMNYCICIWGGASVKLINKLYKIQKRAARIILCDHSETSSKELFQKLKWMNIFQRMEYIRCLMMCKIYNKFVPEYIYKDFSIKKQCTNFKQLYFKSTVLKSCLIIVFVVFINILLLFIIMNYQLLLDF